MKEIDFEMLKKRREKVLALRKTMDEKQHIGLGYVMTVDGKQYPVLSCFPVGTETEEARARFKYLINGQKKLAILSLDF